MHTLSMSISSWLSAGTMIIFEMFKMTMLDTQMHLLLPEINYRRLMEIYAGGLHG